MAYADWAFYKEEYLGIIIESAEAYGYFAERASDELARYAKCVPQTEEAQTALKKSTCAIADILYNDFSASKHGQRMSSESVSGYYSVSYTVNDSSTIRKTISQAISKYLGVYLFQKSKKIII